MSEQGSTKIERAIDEIRQGRMVILVDDEDRENEGDLVLAAQLVTPEAINFMTRFGRGLVCLALTEERVQRLGLPMMVTENRAPLGTAFTVSIEARQGVTTGISAADRSHTIRTAVGPQARPEDLVSPGHVFPLRARRGGVLKRTGQTEGSVDLARLAGLEPAAVICEIMNDDGTMARRPDLERFAATHGLTIATVADLVEYRLKHESLVRRVREGTLSVACRDGEDIPFRAVAYTTVVEETEYLALVLGQPGPARPTLVRVQAACVPGDVFASRGCDCGSLLRQALRRIAEEGEGVFLYIFPQARASLVRDLETHVLHTAEGAPQKAQKGEPGDRPHRDFGLGAQVLADLGLRRVRLLTNHPKKLVGLEAFGIEVVEVVPVEVPRSPALTVVGGRRDA